MKWSELKPGDKITHSAFTYPGTVIAVGNSSLYYWYETISGIRYETISDLQDGYKLIEPKKKPSERIRELAFDGVPRSFEPSDAKRIAAIERYLDEQAEKENE